MKHIANKNLPPRGLLFETIVCALALDYWHAPGWAVGVVATLLAILWIAAFVLMFKGETVDIFEELERRR